MNPRGLRATICFSLLLGILPAQIGRTSRSYLGRVLPDLDAAAKGSFWINSREGVRLSDLRSGPTLVCFTNFT